MTPAAPRVCQYCMYYYALPGQRDDKLCGITHARSEPDHTCHRWQAGYAAKKFVADAIHAEMIERARRQATKPVQLSFDDETRINSDSDIDDGNK